MPMLCAQDCTASPASPGRRRSLPAARSPTSGANHSPARLNPEPRGKPLRRSSAEASRLRLNPRRLSMLIRFAAGFAILVALSAPAFAGCDQAQAVDKMTKVATALGHKAGEAKTEEDSKDIVAANEKVNQ